MATLAASKIAASVSADSGLAALADAERRQVLLNSLNLGVLGLSAVVTAMGVYNARKRPAVVDIEVPIQGLPPALHGFRIAQLSDLHVGPTIKRPFVAAVVETVNSLDADLIAFTGDLADGSVDRLRAHVAPLASLRARHGCLFVTGNHEYYSGVEEWLHEIRRLGMDVLMNEHRLLRHGSATLLVASVTDFGAAGEIPHSRHRSDPRAAFAAGPASGVRILLAHQPRTALDTEDVDFDLQLSGHTHGGQFAPWKYLIPLQQPYVAGLHRIDEKAWIYVSRGTGYWGPPLRLRAPAEITRITLVAC